MSPQLCDHCVGSIVGVPNVVHTFCNNLLFVNVRDYRSDSVSVDQELKFVLAPGNFVFCMECLLVVGESGKGDPWVSERRFGGEGTIQGVVVCDLARLVFADDEGEDAAFPPYRLVLKVVTIWAIASTSSSIASYLADPVMRGISAASKRALTIASMATTLVIVMASLVSVHSRIGMA